MNKEELERSIELAKVKPIPRCPPTLESNVLRRVRLAQSAADERIGVDWLFGVFQQSRFAAAGLAAVLLVSATASAVVSSAHASSAERRGLAAKALGFEVFQETEILKLDK